MTEFDDEGMTTLELDSTEPPWMTYIVGAFLALLLATLGWVLVLLLILTTRAVL